MLVAPLTRMEPERWRTRWRLNLSVCSDRQLLLVPQAGPEGVVHRQRRDVGHQGVDQPPPGQVAPRAQDQGGAAADPDGGEWVELLGPRGQG